MVWTHFFVWKLRSSKLRRWYNGCRTYIGCHGLGDLGLIKRSTITAVFII